MIKIIAPRLKSQVLCDAGEHLQQPISLGCVFVRVFCYFTLSFNDAIYRCAVVGNSGKILTEKEEKKF